MKTAQNMRGTGIVVLAAAFFLSACADSATTQTTSASLQYETAAKLASAHIAKFDTLDFDVFSNQKWDRLQESHAKEIQVHWPDGHVAIGIDKHIEDLKAMFVYAPDTRIKVHPSVIGEMEGTFTQPMPIGAGKTIPPTGKAFKIVMRSETSRGFSPRRQHWTARGPAPCARLARRALR